MTPNAIPVELDIPALLKQLARLTERIDPLNAILAAEAKPGLTERIERFLLEVDRISHHMDRAATAMEADRDSRDAIQRIDVLTKAQAQRMDGMAADIRAIRELFEAPLNPPGRN